MAQRLPGLNDPVPEHLAKVRVAGSNPVVRSERNPLSGGGFVVLTCGFVACPREPWSSRWGSGFIFTTVGYAYLPDGPFPELEINDLGVPEFPRFDGHWYQWSASN